MRLLRGIHVRPEFEIIYTRLRQGNYVQQLGLSLVFVIIFSRFRQGNRGCEQGVHVPLTVIHTGLRQENHVRKLGIPEFVSIFSRSSDREIMFAN